MTVSVVIPTRNRAKLLDDAIKSVLGQTRELDEIIIVDDSDTQETKEMVESYTSQNANVLYVKANDLKSAARSRNEGIRASSTDCIAFLDDDDIWMPDKIEKQMAVLESEPRIGFVYCHAWYVDDNDEIIGAQEKWGRGNVWPRQIASAMVGGTQTVVARRNLILNVGLFDERMKYWDDQELYIRLAQVSEVECVSKHLVKLRICHGHDRMTDETFGKLKNSIDDLEYIYKKYSIPLASHPLERAMLASRISLEYYKIKDFWGWSKWVASAIAVNPTAAISISTNHIRAIAKTNRRIKM